MALPFSLFRGSLRSLSDGASPVGSLCALSGPFPTVKPPRAFLFRQKRNKCALPLENAGKMLYNILEQNGVWPNGKALHLGACRKILFRFRKAPQSGAKAVKKREIARSSFRGFPHDHMKGHNNDHMKNGGRKSKFHISGCGPMVRRYIWEQDYARCLPM